MSLGTVTPGLYGSINPSSGTTQATGAYLVRWLDRLGNVVASTGADAGQSFSAPQVPAVTGLANGRWSEAATLVSRDVDILPLYDTADGKGHVFIEASALLGLTATVKVTKTDGSTLLIEWGDGTTDTSTDTGAVTVTHLYVDGSFEAKFSISAGTGEFSMGHGATGNPFIAGVAVTELWMRSTSTSIPAYSLNGTAFRTMAAIIGANGVASVGESGAAAAWALKYIALPVATVLGASAFSADYAVSSVYLPLVSSIGDSALIGLFACTTIYLPELITAGVSALSSNFRVASLILPKLVTAGASCVSSAYALTYLYAPLLDTIGASMLASAAALPFFVSDASSVGASFFTSSHSALYVNLRGAVTVGAQALQSCRLLESVTIGPLCTSIGNLALDGIRNLRALRIEAATPPTLFSSASLADFDPRLVIQVPAESLAAYQSASNWSTFAARMVGY